MPTYDDYNADLAANGEDAYYDDYVDMVDNVVDADGSIASYSDYTDAVIASSADDVTDFSNYADYLDVYNDDEDFIDYDDYASQYASTDNDAVTQDQYQDYVSDYIATSGNDVVDYSTYQDTYDDYSVYVTSTLSDDIMTYDEYIAELTDSGYGFIIASGIDASAYTCNDDQIVLCSFDHNGFTYTIVVEDNGQNCVCSRRWTTLWNLTYYYPVNNKFPIYLCVLTHHF